MFCKDSFRRWSCSSAEQQDLRSMSIWGQESKLSSTQLGCRVSQETFIMAMGGQCRGKGLDIRNYPETLMSAFFKLILPLLFLCRPHYVITGNGMRMSPWIIHSSFAMLHSSPWLFLSMFLHPYGSIAIDVEWHSVFPKIYNCAVLRVNGPLLFNL